jgi:hypothetical protein
MGVNTGWVGRTEYDPLRTTVIRARDRPETFLTRRILTNLISLMYPA